MTKGVNLGLLLMDHRERIKLARPVAQALGMEFDEFYMLYHIMEIAHYEVTISGPVSDPDFAPHINRENVDYLLDEFLVFPQQEGPRHYARRFLMDRDYREGKLEQWREHLEPVLRRSVM